MYSLLSSVLLALPRLFHPPSELPARRWIACRLVAGFLCLSLVSPLLGQETASIEPCCPADDRFSLLDDPGMIFLDEGFFSIEPETVELPVAAGASLDDLLDRLTRTESRLSELENGQTALQEVDAEFKKAWFSRFNFSGYAQFRINGIVTQRSGSVPAQHNGDGSVGKDQGVIIRRARLVYAGDVTDHISIYFQPDFASNVPGSPDGNQFAQIRDWYADIHLDDAHEYRFRVGQSKIPYGWENLQSSRNRLPLDRNDALNSAARNERDLGVFFYWTPTEAQDFFDAVLDEGLKGSGNYGVLGFGFYNGQGGSFREQNDNLHVIARLTLPITLADGQRMELGIQGYTGKYTVLSSPISPLGVGAPVRPAGTLETGNVGGILDQRLAGTFVYYPQPLGFQAEWTVGRGPALNPAQTAVVDRALYGGYAMVMYRQQTREYGEIFPFFRWNYYQGGYKAERNSPFSSINEWELGLEWQMTKYLELVSMYTITDRTNTRSINAADTLSYQQFRGDLARFQFQVRY